MAPRVEGSHPATKLKLMPERLYGETFTARLLRRVAAGRVRNKSEERSRHLSEGKSGEIMQERSAIESGMDMKQEVVRKKKSDKMVNATNNRKME